MDLSTFDYQEMGGVPVIRASGEIDLSNIHSLESHLERVSAAPAAAVILSLEGVSYLGSTTFHALEKWAQQLGRNGGELLVVKPANPTGKHVFELVHLDGYARIFDTIEAATERATQLRSTGERTGRNA